MLVPWRLQEGIVLFLFIDEAANSMLVTPKNGETAEDRRSWVWSMFWNVQHPTWKMDDSGPWNHMLKTIGTGCIVPAARRLKGMWFFFHMMKHIIFFIWLPIIVVEYEACTYNWTYFSWANSCKSVWNVSLDPSPSRKRLVLPTRLPHLFDGGIYVCGKKKSFCHQ